MSAREFEYTFAWRGNYAGGGGEYHTGGFRRRENPSSQRGGDVWRGSRPAAIKQPRQGPQVFVCGSAKATTGSRAA